MISKIVIDEISNLANRRKQELTTLRSMAKVANDNLIAAVKAVEAKAAELTELIDFLDANDEENDYRALLEEK